MAIAHWQKTRTQTWSSVFFPSQSLDQMLIAEETKSASSDAETQ
jgi:hypothetical protein